MGNFCTVDGKTTPNITTDRTPILNDKDNESTTAGELSEDDKIAPAADADKTDSTKDEDDTKVEGDAGDDTYV